MVAQRLARRLCDRCKEGYQHDGNDLIRLGFPMAPDGGVPLLFRPVGCVACSNTGYRGRIALHEVMIVNEEIERLAVARASNADLMRAAIAGGMLTLRQDGWAKVALGHTSIEEVLRVVA